MRDGTGITRPQGTPRAVAICRRVALAGTTLLVLAADVVAFAESFRGLHDWALSHGVHSRWAAVWPLQVDAFIAVGEFVLFVAFADGWSLKSRLGAWAVTLGGLAVSVAGNVGQAHTAVLADRVTWALPPLAAAGMLAVGLGVLKRTAGTQRGSVRPLRLVEGGRSAEDLAREILTGNPDLPGKQLGAMVGVSERTGRRLRARVLAGVAA